ncbi:MAG: hypothetical protein OEL91_02635 [Burkholderiaceae bacterium]|nr:hypothetical protein [Burkholderiaceae bacterium]
MPQPALYLCQTTSRTSLLGALAVALALGGAGLAYGEANPYYVGASQSFTHDSNLVRLADGVTLTQDQIDAGVIAKSDRIATTSLFGGIDQPFGRQRFYANAAVHYSRFSENTIYDNTGYALATGLDWSTRERISGRLRASSNQKLASFNLNETVGGSSTARIATKRNSQTTDQLSAVFRIGTVTPLTLESEVRHMQLDYSLDDFKFREFNQNSVDFRGRYRSSSQLTLGSGLRLTRGRYPLTTNKFTGRYLDLTAAWAASGLSTIKGRLSLGRTKHSRFTQKTSTRATGSLDWNWLLTGKLRMRTHLRRDTGEDSIFASDDDSAVIGVSENSRVTTTILAAGQYQATDKISLNASLSYARRSLFDSRAQSIGAQLRDGSDRTRVVRFGASYAPARSVQLSCNLSRESRSASGELSSAYSANVSRCSAQFTLGR